MDRAFTPLLSLAEAARILGIGKTKLREHLREKRLSSVHQGRRHQIRGDVLADFVERLTRGEV